MSELGITELKLEVTLRDSRAIEIVEHMPIERRNEIIEKYIILGDMVVSYASIETRKEVVEDFFSPLIETVNTIREQLKLIVPTITTPIKKGEITVETIFQSLREHFLEDSFEDVSRTGKYTDILATTSDTKIPLLIEIKDYKNTVPSEEVDKFWRDMERRGTKYGIFISMRSDIAKCSGCINIKSEPRGTAVFVVNSELNWMGHIFAYHVIKKIAYLEVMKKKELKSEDLSNVVRKINENIRDIQNEFKLIEEIQRIADGLKTTCKNKLEELIELSNIYKRKVNEKIADTIEEIKKVEV
ncbi:MAG: restriction endonuclease [Candidatus Methanomethylicaceae archaeon]